tara:strand:- start:689 stop:1471 length:783 start_codon:yes stop_codon:yes gene_type:complete
MTKIFTLIQGPPTHSDQVIDHYKGVDNVIWVTQETESEGALSAIEKSNITLLTYEGDCFAGHSNINLQLKSTQAGLGYCEQENASHILKIRSDLIFEDPKSFTDIMCVNDRVQCYFYVKHNPQSHFQMSAEYRAQVDNWIKWAELDSKIEDLGNYDYTCDYLNFGPLEEMKRFWNIPLETQIIPVPAEIKLMHRYLNEKCDKPYRVSYEFLSENIFDFFLSRAAKDNPLYSLKNDYSSVELFNTSDTIKEGRRVMQGYAG